MAAGPPSAPRYVAIITDGNGRWAKARGLKVVEGHRAGADTVKARLRDAAEFGIEELTVYSFSTENWSRPKAEVSALMRMFAQRIERGIGAVRFVQDLGDARLGQRRIKGIEPRRAAFANGAPKRGGLCGIGSRRARAQQGDRPARIGAPVAL